MAKTCRAIFGILALLGLSAGVSAFAKPLPKSPEARAPTETSAPPPLVLKDVIVTAQRVAQRIERVPQSITVIGAKELAQRGIDTQRNLQFAVPGLTVRATDNTNQVDYVLRGESVDAYSGSVPGVQPYIDDVPFAANTADTFYDLQNVQVLKGPQGTLFGRNTTGGAVLFQTAKPTSRFGGYVSVQYGNLRRLITQGAVNIPIVKHKVLLRLAGSYTSGGAFVRNLYNGQLLGDQLARSGRATLLLRPTAGITNTTMAEFSSFGGTNAANFPYYVVPCGGTGPGLTCGFSPSVPAFESLINSKPGTYFPNYPSGYVYPGGMATLTQYLKSRGQYVVDSNGTFPHKAWNDLVINTTAIKLSPATKIKNIFGYAFSHAQNAYDNDATPYPMLQAGGGAPGGSEFEDLRTHQISDEMQLIGKTLNRRLSYIIGGFFIKEEYNNNSPITGLGIIAPINFIYTFAVRYHAKSEDESYAGYAQGTYRVTNRFHVTVGVRGTTDRLNIQQLVGSAFGSGFQHVTETRPSWNVSLTYQFNPQLMTYFTASGSWRVGGYDPFVPPPSSMKNVTAAQGGNYFDPETLTEAELGEKYNGHIGRVALQVNADIYNNWVYNVQQTAYSVVSGNITSATVNVPSAQVSGFEGDFKILPTHWLRLGGSLSYTDARYISNKGNLYGKPVRYGPYGDTPRITGALNAAVTKWLPNDAGRLTYRADVYAQSLFYFSNLNSTLTPGTKISGYGLVDMRLIWADPLGADGLTISAFVKNLTNKLYFVGGSPAAQDTSAETSVFGMPRTYGVIVRYGFR